MADSEVVQEFLVSLGFKLDDSQRARFDAAMGSNRASAAALDAQLAAVGKQLGLLGDQLLKVSGHPTREAENAADRLAKRHDALQRGVKQLGLTAVTATTAFVAGFAEMAKAYEQLYYVSQRTGVSAQGLAAGNFGGSQIGLNSGDIQAATEAIATAARNPGIKNLIESWGVASNDLRGIVHHLAALPPYLQDAYAGMLGISGTTLRNLINNQDQYDKSVREFNARIAASGVDYKKFIDDTVDITRSLGTVWSQVETIGVQSFEEVYPAAHKLLGVTEGLLDTTIKWNAAHPGFAAAEGYAVATVGAVGLLGVLGKISGLPLLRFGVLGALMYGTYEGGKGFVENMTPEGAAARRKQEDKYGIRSPIPDPAEVLGWLFNVGRGNTWQSHVPGTVDWFKGISGRRPGYGTEGDQGPIGDVGPTLGPTSSDAVDSWLRGNSTYHPVVQVLGLEAMLSGIGASGGFGVAGGGVGVDRSGGPQSSVGGRSGETGGGGFTSGTVGGGGWEAASEIIQQYESSGGKNIPNGQGSSAFGPWQILQGTWNDIAPRAGVDLGQYPTARSAPITMQEQVARKLWETRGFQPWTIGNPALARALAGGALASYATGNAVPGGASPVTGVNPEFAHRIEDMVAHMPPELRKKFQIISGFRDAARQRQVNPGVTNSHHTQGMAVDTTWDPAVRAWIREHGSEYGVGYPLLGNPKEGNHLEPLEGGKRIMDMQGWRRTHLGGDNSTASSSSGDKHVELNHPVTVHIHGDAADASQRVLSALNDHSGRFLRNAEATIT
jgi:hypothetical protein